MRPPFLNRWRFKEASHAWGFALLIFDNAEKGEHDDLAEANLIQANNNGFASGHAMMGGARNFIQVPDILPPMSGGYMSTPATYAMLPLCTSFVSESAISLPLNSRPPGRATS
jgi:hypothetical protein